MEQNKIRKYLLYALGEILLVVIGILIALQVNTWNEQRMLNQKELDYLREIRNNLEEDLSEIRDIKAFNVRKDSIINSIILTFSEGHTDQELGSALGENMPLLTEFGVFTRNRAAYDNMVDSENLSVIHDDSLRVMIYKYYSQDDYVTFGSQQRVQNLTRRFADYTTPALIHNEAIEAYFGMGNDLPYLEENDLRGDKILFTNLAMLAVSTSAQTEFLENIEPDIHQLIQAIENYLQ